jgi:CubicO group peptidase (beta-lactamase class C family)
VGQPESKPAARDTLGTVNFDQIDAVAERFAGNGRQPGFAYGIVIDGELAHVAGLGERVLGTGQVPDADTVFRIASMSKSFTASVIMSLRDEGALALTDPVADYVKELRDWPLVTRDARPVAIADLLTMTAGFPTDDPWGDRQQGMPLDEFGALLAGGVGFNWAPGTRFEYSNLGYAILGRLITAVTGRPFKDVVRERFLTPLGMTSTGYEESEFPADRLARGYRKAPEGWEELPYDPYGAFAPMGGVFSTVRDLTRWVAGFAAAFPPGDDVVSEHPLSRASRREMQLSRVIIPGGKADTAAYGYGLFMGEDPARGRVVGHSGGYPGFGSNMRWHPATGIGVIALANGTYANMSILAGQLLAVALHDLASRPGVPLAPGQAPWPRTLAAADTVNGLLSDWDDAVADRLFAPNVRQDAPYPERRAQIARLRDRLGTFAPAGDRPAESDTPAHRRWWLTGDRGTAQVQIQLSPQLPPRVQSLTIAVPPADGSALARAMESVVKVINEGGNLRVAAGSDVDRWVRRLRMAAAWAGPVRPGAWRAGDGETAVVADLVGEHATIQLTLAVDATGAIRDLTLNGL